MLGASDPVVLHGELSEKRKKIVRAIEKVIREVGEERLRVYWVGLKEFKLECRAPASLQQSNGPFVSKLIIAF